MAFRMAKLDRKQSGAYTARKVIPVDVRADYHALYGKKREELFHAPAGERTQRAKVLQSQWLADIENRIATLRAKKRGEGRDLTQREAQALAGQWYRWFVGLHEDNPGDPQRWRHLVDVLMGAVMDATQEWDAQDPFIDQSQREREPAVREDVHPRLADEAKTAQFLASLGETLTRDAMTTFLDCILSDFLSACDLLGRRARGDYSPDTLPQSFPEYDRRKPKAASGRTCFEIFTAYVEARQPAASGVNRWRVVFKTLDSHLAGRDIEAFSLDDAQCWATSLIVAKRGARTVKDVWQSAAYTVTFTLDPKTGATLKCVFTK